MSALGVEINDFHIPFCTRFEEKIINDQLCYSINLNKTRQKNQVKEEHDLTFKLFISYNEDRQFDSMVDVKMPRKVDDSNLEKYVLVETIGRLLYVALSIIQIHVLDPLKLEVGKEYNLNNVKEIVPTDDFLTLDRDTIGCQNEESSNECKTRQYIDALIDQCGCIPFWIGNLKQV